jgi:hypothetical protein
MRAASNAPGVQGAQRIGAPSVQLLHRAVVAHPQRRWVTAGQPPQLAVGGIPERDGDRQEAFRIAQAPDRLVDVLGRLDQTLAAAARRPNRAQRQRRERGRHVALPGRVGDHQPDALGVARVVEEVAPDLVAGQDAAGERRPVEPGDPRRQQVLLDLGGGLDLLAPAGGVDHVGVARDQLQRQRRLLRERGEVLVRLLPRQQEPEHAVADHHRHHHAPGQHVADQPLQRVEHVERHLRADAQGRVDALRERRRLAGQPDGSGAVEVDDVQRHRHARDARRRLHDAA